MDHVTVQEAEQALEALGNLLYLIEIDYRNEEHLEAYLLMSRAAMEKLHKWFYDDACRLPEES
jgi:hypothetical protein